MCEILLGTHLKMKSIITPSKHTHNADSFAYANKILFYGRTVFCVVGANISFHLMMMYYYFNPQMMRDGIVFLFAVLNKRLERYAVQAYKHLERDTIRSDYFMLTTDETQNISSIVVGAPTLFTAYFVFATPKTATSIVRKV